MATLLWQEPAGSESSAGQYPVWTEKKKFTFFPPSVREMKESHGCLSNYDNMQRFLVLAKPEHFFCSFVAWMQALKKSSLTLLCSAT